MAGVPAAVEQAIQNFMESSGVVHVDDYKARKGGSGGDLTVCLPDIYCRNADIEQGDDIDVYVDSDIGAMVVIPVDNHEDERGVFDV